MTSFFSSIVAKNSQGRQRLLFFFLPLLTSCGPMSMKELRSEGDSEIAQLTAILREVDGKEDLVIRLPKIKKEFTKIAELALQVRAIQEKDPAFLEPSQAGDELFGELTRLYEIPGCRDLIESAQNEAIHRLTR